MEHEVFKRSALLLSHLNALCIGFNGIRREKSAPPAHHTAQPPSPARTVTVASKQNLVTHHIYIGTLPYIQTAPLISIQKTSTQIQQRESFILGCTLPLSRLQGVGVEINVVEGGLKCLQHSGGLIETSPGTPQRWRRGREGRLGSDRWRPS